MMLQQQEQEGAYCLHCHSFPQVYGIMAQKALEMYLNPEHNQPT